MQGENSGKRKSAADDEESESDEENREITGDNKPGVLRKTPRLDDGDGSNNDEEDEEKEEDEDNKDDESIPDEEEDDDGYDSAENCWRCRDDMCIKHALRGLNVKLTPLVPTPWLTVLCFDLRYARITLTVRILSLSRRGLHLLLGVSCPMNWTSMTLDHQMMAFPSDLVLLQVPFMAYAYRERERGTNTFSNRWLHTQQVLGLQFQ